MSIFVTGDIHGNVNRFYDEKYLISSTLRGGDYLIVAGDWGLIFAHPLRYESQVLDELNDRIAYTLLVVPGNHENYDRIAQYPVVDFHGGRVRKIRERIYTIERGSILNLDGHKVFCFGGGYSIDRAYRIEGRSWWPEEMPSEEDYQRAKTTLDANDWNVDLIVTHAAPENTMMRFHPHHEDEQTLNFFLEYVREHCSYRAWCFGHLHGDKDLWREQHLLYYDLFNLETLERHSFSLCNL